MPLRRNHIAADSSYTQFQRPTTRYVEIKDKRVFVLSEIFWLTAFVVNENALRGAPTRFVEKNRWLLNKSRFLLEL
jgi:hypothetical protein